MGENQTNPESLPDDYPERIRRLRQRLGLTQLELAGRLGVSFTTVNRWENRQTKPSPLAWEGILRMDGGSPTTAAGGRAGGTERKAAAIRPADFTAPPEAVRVLAECERLSFGHMFNPAFATETSLVDPLPHQRIAVYEHMLKQMPLRFLLADDAGAGKTIMSGLYVREMLARGLIRRILVVTPAGLLGNWQRELSTLFGLRFRIVTGQDARGSNPFSGETGDHVIVSVDTLAGEKMFSRLRESPAYELVIFDEAHKLSADRDRNLRIVKTDRYKLAEGICGVPDADALWQLPWSARHVLLLTATPHQGKDFPYYALWRLLEPEVLSTPEALSEYPRERRAEHFIRRTKEEMVFLNGKPLYPRRVSDTLAYDLAQGEVSEQRLYDETTEYMRYVYNRAKLLNRSAARMAMGVMQRRLASSTFALLRSFERRLEKLNTLIEQVQDGRLTTEQLDKLQRQIAAEEDPLDSKTADDETGPIDGREENECAEDQLLSGVIAASLTDLVAERQVVVELRKLAGAVHELGIASKFEKLRDIFTDSRFADEKLIIFTEHRDTLEYIVQRLSGMGYTGQIAQIHGGMDYLQRQEQVERFRRHHAEGGARFMVCTDAAAEGINLQFCWIMVNYDVPWNPARLEQRMGRIHRYGQKHDPVVILNLVAPKTREGIVLKVLLDKLEAIRGELNSDKVFDSIGRIFEGVSIRQYMEQAIDGDAGAAAEELAGKLTAEQVAALAAREKMLFGSGGDVVVELPRLRGDMQRETYCRLLPGYVRQFIESAAPLVDMAVEGDMNGRFALVPLAAGATDALRRAMEAYPAAQRGSLTVLRPDGGGEAIWMHPGEPVFERFRDIVRSRLRPLALRGAIFVDPAADKPYLFHLALASVVSGVDGEVPGPAEARTLECRLVGVRQQEGAELVLCPVEHLLLLGGGRGIPAGAQRLAVQAEGMAKQAAAFVEERVARDMALLRRKQLLEAIPEREKLLKRGFDFQEAELAKARALLREKLESGKHRAALEQIINQQRSLAKRRAAAIEALHREPDLIAPGETVFIAHALVVPTTDAEELRRQDAQVEQVAMRVASAFEQAAGGRVQDVHTPELARGAGLTDNPGFDLLSTRPNGERLAVEVKGRAGIGDVEISANEWARAANLRSEYWLYVVYDCATPAPRLVRVRDPFQSLLARAKGSVLVGAGAVAAAGER
jgi:superfamily II DNA or RNA helicase/DNA-binding XRE family transcriptional regulator